MKRPLAFWIVIGVVAFLCVFGGVYAALNIFGGDPKRLPPTVTVIPSLISVQPTQTSLPTATRVIATVIPGLTSVSPTVIPSFTPVPPTAKSSPTSSPTVKPSVTVVSPTATQVPPTANPSATVVPPTAKPSATSVPPTAIPTINPIQNINWQWVSLMDEGTPSNVPNPADYTLIFNSNGTLNGKADCNSFKGTYSQQNGLIISINSSTTAFCGEGSLDTMYLSLLGSVVAGGPDGTGGLALETMGGTQRMTFK